MYLFTVALHVILCLVLVLIILLQPGKGGDVGAAFGGGGGSNTLFGPRGPANLLSRATTGAFAMFMVTSVVLALYSNKRLLANANIDDELERLETERAKELEDALRDLALPPGMASEDPAEQPPEDPPTP